MDVILSSIGLTIIRVVIPFGLLLLIGNMVKQRQARQS
jgi:hypothetical protein